jgi:MFS family permease
MEVPFFFAAGISFIGTLCTVFLLKETNTKEKRGIAKANKFSFLSLITTLKMPVIGTAIFIGFLLTMAQFTMIIGFQAITIDTLNLSTTQLGLLYAGFAITGIIMQLCVPFFIKIFSSRSLILLLSTAICLAAMFLTGLTGVFISFTACLCIYGLFNGLRNPMLNAIIADNNTTGRQGEVMGVNQSWGSVGQIIGPITAGLITVISVHCTFFLAAFYILIAFLFTFRLRLRTKT